MCKILIIKGIDRSDLALSFMKAVEPIMTEGNTDGIGYSAINSKNKLFSEKWHKNKHFLDTTKVLDAKTMKDLEQFKDRLPSNVTQNYKSYGTVTREDLKTITMHTRFATCGKEFDNTHPFIDNEMSLIHNGTITNSHEIGLNKVSSCDSENGLQLYINMGINLETNPDKIQEYINQLKGGWAFGILAKGASGQYIVDIVRERSSLYWTILPEMGDDCVVFATTEKIIETGIKELGFRPRDTTEIFSLSESNYHRFNAVTGEFIDNFILKTSKLNEYTFDWDKWRQNQNRHNSNNSYNIYDDYYDNYSNNIHIVNKEPIVSAEDQYEGYVLNKMGKYEAKKFKEQLQGIDDDLSFDVFYDTDSLLIDRLYEYDVFMGTKFGDSYEDLPPKVRLFIEKKEEEGYIVFDVIIEMLEEFMKTVNISSIYKIYKSKKRA